MEMKICIISSDFNFEPLGGRNVTLKRLMEGIVEKYPGTEFHVLTRKGRKRIEKRGNIFSYRLEKFEKNAKETARILDKRINFDMIHGFDVYPDGYLTVSISYSLKKPCIVGLRGVYILKAGELILKYVAKRADYVVAVDKKSMELFRKITGRKGNICSINNSIKPFSIPKRKKRDKNFIIGNVTYLGDVRKTKGWDYLLDAFKRIRKEIPLSKLVLIGSSDTSKTSKIGKSIEEKGIENDVLLKGVMTHEKTLEEVADFDVYVSPSTFEGMPNAVLEAMILKKPVIATESGGVPEIIKDEYNGLLVREFSPDEIYEKLMMLYRNKDYGKMLGKNACKMVAEEFSPEKEIEAWYKLYKRLYRRMLRKL
jgi:glycosyltransferase involved in cell wall biosynthesis